MNIEYWRSEIDAIDNELLRLLNMRARLAIKVGSLKTAAYLPLCDPQREAQILDHVREANAGPLDDEAITKLFRHIINVSREAEKENREDASVAMEEVAL